MDDEAKQGTWADDRDADDVAKLEEVEDEGGPDARTEDTRPSLRRRRRRVQVEGPTAFADEARSNNIDDAIERIKGLDDVSGLITSGG